jgi:hypothetical protein
MKDLHRCSSLCRRWQGSIHSPFCEYVDGVDYQAATDAAVAFLTSHPGQTFSGLTGIEAVAPHLTPQSPQAELTLSFLTDPIELKNQDSDFDNGRHRVAALIDTGVTGPIPFTRV